MVTKRQILKVKELSKRSQRTLQGLFIAEGDKVVQELIQTGLIPKELYTTKPEKYSKFSHVCLEVTKEELQRLSHLKAPSSTVGVFPILPPSPIRYEGLILALDRISDPGNFGTILRICDWFGISQIVCSPTCVDQFNPKTVQASAGSIQRISVTYTDLEPFLKGSTLPVYGALLNGKNLYETKLPKEAILVMGSEANGISTNLIPYLNIHIHIPRYGANPGVESLNVAISTSVILGEWRSRSIRK